MKKGSSTTTPTVSYSASGSSISSSALTPSGSHGFRSQLGHLLPRHALFQVHLHIEELTNVPLITGQFAVRWKFKNVQSGSGLLSKMKGHRNWTNSNANRNNHKTLGKGKGKEVVRMDEPALEIEVVAEDEDDKRGEDEDVDEGNSSDDEGSYPVPSNHSDVASSNVYGDYLTASPPSTPVPAPASLAQAPASGSGPPGPMTRSQSSLGSNGSQSEARGVTPWQKLQSYNVRWDHSVNVVVSMDVHRESFALLPSPLKLIVQQRVIAGDPDAPQHPRLGAVYLNLAEYVDKGKVERRYLLRQSKTNATLKVAIELEHVGGEKEYVPPPLKKGEVLGAVAGILSNDLLRAQIARELDEYTRAHSPSPWGVPPLHVHHPHNHNHVHDADEDDAHSFETLSYPYPYATPSGHILPDHLASSYGLHMTETLIEALFNPLPSSEPDSSPFTYYVPQPSGSPRPRSEPESQRRGGADDASSGSFNADGDNFSFFSSSTHASGNAASDSAIPSSSKSNPSTSSTVGEAEAPGAGTNKDKGWWKKISRPSTPLSRWSRRPSTPGPGAGGGSGSQPVVTFDSPGTNEPQEVVS